MADTKENAQPPQGIPQPDPALKRLDRLVGTWSSVYSNLSPAPLPYKWDLQGDTLTISVSYGPLNATFTGKFSPDGKSFSGGWRANPGADETVNVPYDIGGTRIGG